MEIEFPTKDEKKKILYVARNQHYLLYLGRKFGYLHPRIYDIAFETYKNFRMLKFFGLKNYLFGNRSGLVNFLLVGFPKCGTTSLHEYLLQHPKFDSMWIKEPHFFSYSYYKGIKYYLQNFRFQNNVNYFESSTDYIYFPDVFKRIKLFNPNMKFIVCLRNPIDQIFSNYNHLKQVGLESDSFENALSQEEFKKELHLNRLKNNIYTHQKAPIQIPYIYFAEYVKHLKPALDVFPQENFYFVNSTDLLKNTQHVMDKIFDFLNEDSISINPEFHNKRTYENKMSADSKKYLSEHFEPFNHELEKLLNLKFNWN